jgi:indole-3-glycerol phosphate synthase
MTILDEIILNRKREVSVLEQVSPVAELEKSDLFRRECLSMSDSLRARDKTGIIAEFKRRSPSKGLINEISPVEEVIKGYFGAGASGVSILTENKYFGGSVEDLLIVRDKSLFPILRKDFIVSEYQVLESKSIGADVILLIAAALEEDEIYNLAGLASSLGMEVLLEIHELAELSKVNQYIDIIGVNNRDLKTFRVNTKTSVELSASIPGNFLKISESGISSPSMIKELRQAGYNGFLIGERFMHTSDPVKAFTDFVQELSK